jgi:hypothetical protein
MEAATDRQRAYAMNFQSSSVYTPQAVINGASGVVGSDEAAVRGGLRNVPFPGHDVSVERKAGRLIVSLPETALNGSECMVELISLAPSATVDIQRGENAGTAITYRNTVRAEATLGVWKGEAKVIEMPLTEQDRAEGLSHAVLVRTLLASGRPGPVIGAALVQPNE